MKRVTLVGFVGLSCLVAACGNSAGQQEESVGQVSSAMVDKSVSIGDTPVSPANEEELLGNVAAGAGIYVVGWGRADGDSSAAVVTRVSSTGEILDPHGILVPNSEESGSYAPDISVAFDGTNFRVQTWDGLALLTPEGEWLDGPTELDRLSRGVVCMDDGNCYGLNSEYVYPGNYWERRFVRIDKNNELATEPGTGALLEEIDSDHLANASARLVRVGERIAYVFTALDTNDSYSMRVWVEFFDPKSNTTTPALDIATAYTQYSDGVLAVAGREGEALFVWCQYGQKGDSEYGWTPLARRIGSDGKALEDARAIALPEEECSGIDSMVYTGSDYVLSTGGSTLHRLSDVGALTKNTLSLGRDDSPDRWSLASGGDTLLMATSHSSTAEYPSDPRLFTKLFQHDGAELGVAQPIEPGTNRMSEPAVAWGGQSYFAVWVDDRNGLGRADLFGARVSPDGKQLDATALSLGTFADTWQSKPAIASSGNGYLIVDHAAQYLYYSNIGATFVDADGVPAPGVRLSGSGQPQSAPVVAWNGKSYLIAWIGNERGVLDLHATRFDEKGTRLDDGNWIATVAVDTDGAWAPTLAATSDGFFLSWRQQAGGAERDVFGVWLDDSSGKLVTRTAPKSLTGGPFVDATVANQDTGAACSPDVCLVSWYDASGDTKFRRFDSKGEPLSPVATLPETVHRPIVAWDGKAFLISNVENRVVAGYISEAGVILTPELLPAGPEKLSALSGAALATDGAGHALIVTAGEGHDRFTGTFLSNDVVPDDGSGGQGGEPATTTAGTSSAPIGGSTPTTAGTTATDGGAEDGEAGESSAGSGGSSAGATSSARKTDEGCGCSVAGGDTSSSPWLLLGLLGVFARRRRQR